MSIIEGKVWGSTEPMLQSPAIEIHRIVVNAGAYCSQHKHQSKINAFYVIKGELEIKRWKDYGLCDSTFLFPGDMSIVPPGEAHMFKAHQDTEALEIYWSELNHNDIQRQLVGGMSEEIHNDA
tara:strand:+ start:300 stop:668 length:369 start_codon:yes stop_codon:yes gene_type:complete